MFAASSFESEQELLQYENALQSLLQSAGDVGVAGCSLFTKIVQKSMNSKSQIPNFKTAHGITFMTWLKSVPQIARIEQGKKSATSDHFMFMKRPLQVRVCQNREGDQ